MFSATSSVRRRKALSDTGSSNSSNRNRKDSKIERSALSAIQNKSRSPAVDMRSTNDVSTLVCSEVSRAIIENPNINTGSFFTMVAASNNNVNKSDAILVITAAILETLGNTIMAKSILSRSRSVSSFYTRMRLDDKDMRDSVVIMLFALAPEFVKSVESALTTSLERVKALTSAPYAEDRLRMVSTELARTDVISTDEYNRLSYDFNKVNIGSPMGSDFNSIQSTPTDGIFPSDSASRVGMDTTTDDDDKISTIGLMRYIKKTPDAVTDDFYSKFPNARRPVHVKTKNDKNGIGYIKPSSAILDSISEDNFVKVMNEFMPTEKRNIRHSLSRKERILFQRPRVSSASDDEDSDKMDGVKLNDSNDISSDDKSDRTHYSKVSNVNMNDIKETTENKTYTELGYSMVDEEYAKFLDDL